CAVKRHALTEKVTAKCGKGALDSVRSNFHNAWLKRAGNGIERVGHHKKSAEVIKGHAARAREARSEDALHATRVVFVNKTATVVGSAINRNKQVVRSAICSYSAYSKNDNREG